MKILITGDFVVTDEFEGKDLVGESVIKLFEEADYRIINLEAPITYENPKNKITKTGPYLRTSAKTTLPYLKQLKVDMVTLANNHVLDYGEEGLKSTLAFCSENKITTVGAEKNLNTAKTSKRIKIQGKVISVINFSENEWASATSKTGGAHPMDIIDNTRLIQSEKENTDFLIVIIHGGHEFYHFPSPRMQKQYRFYADQGADVIVGHHPHCISGFEVYNETPIFYSLGNFLFTKKSRFDAWYLGLVLQIEINGKNLNTDLIPIKQTPAKFTISTLAKGQKSKILEQVRAYSKVIQDSELLMNEWDNYVRKKSNTYLNHFSISGLVPNKYIKALLYKSGLSEVLTPNKARTLFLNLIRCEAHKDLSKEVLTHHLSKNE